jgi:hypothetical protein
MPFAFLAFALFSFLGMGSENINFDRDATGAVPPYWTPVHTHTGPVGDWVIRRDPNAPSRPNVLSQASPGGRRFEFEIAIFDKVLCRDGDLSAKIRIRSGPGPKTAGLVWRYEDPNNYYMLHLSANERNVVLFHVRNGKAEELPAKGASPSSFGVHHDIRSGVWYLVKVVFRGSSVRVMLGNRLLYDAVDTAPPLEGKTGIWTKGSTVASFDDFRVDKKN